MNDSNAERAILAACYQHNMHDVLAKLKRRFDGSWKTTAWMEKWYPRSSELIVEKYRKGIEEAIRSSLDVMSEAEQLEVESMDHEEYLRALGYVVD